MSARSSSFPSTALVTGGASGIGAAIVARLTAEGAAVTSLDLADVYAVIAYYLRRRADVDAYLEARRSQIAEVRAENERRFDPHGIRDRLIARRGR